MTELLTKAFEQASELPQELQDELARQILKDLIGELKWDETLARTQHQLEALADQALAEFRERESFPPQSRVQESSYP